MQLGDVLQVRIEHHENIVNECLQAGWQLLIPPVLGLRRVMKEENGRTWLTDIPFREFLLAKDKNSLDKGQVVG